MTFKIIGFLQKNLNIIEITHSKFLLKWSVSEHNQILAI